MKKTILFVFCAVISIFIFGCQTTRKDEIPSIKLNEIEPMKIGDTVQLTVELKFFEGNVNFQSNDESIVIVNDSGVVTAIDCGKSTVIASIEKDGKKYSDSIEIEVLENEPVKPSHEHEKCSECGKCTSEECDGEEQDKCQGHEPVKPSHEHEKCSECGKCTSEDCDGEEQDKCQGHEPVKPSHEHEKCSECGKCTSEECDGEEQDKCQGHEPVKPSHEHEKCSECGKCTSEDCDGEEQDKCQGHEPVKPSHEHEKCSECGKCTSEECDGEEQDKCQGHEPVKPSHEHEKCSECGKCTSEECDGEEQDKCQGHEPVKPSHEHEKCSECGKCTSEDCDGEEQDKCQGHEPVKPSHEHEKCSECGKCTSEDCDGEEQDKCQGHEPVKPSHDCSNYKSDWQDVGLIDCGEQGVQQIICTECQKVLEERTIKRNHNYKSTVVTKKTCTSNGVIKYTCSNCNDSYTEIDYSEGHKKSEIKIVEPATETTLGTKRIECEHCGYVYEEFNYVDNAYDRNGKLSVKGRDLVNQYGEKFQLYGLSTHGLQWFSKVVNFDTICEIQENFGNNIIRFALYTDENGYCDGSESKKKQMLETLHKGIDIATQLGLYVIVDWHMVGAENVADKNPLTYLKESKEFFSYISEYYKDQDNILYEIMNEPNGSTTWADCKKYANEVIPCIRKNTDAVVLVGNPKWTADLNSVMNDPLTGYTNIMYTYHFYAADHSNTSQVVKAYDSGFPVFISEFGFMESSGDGDISEPNGNKWKQVLDSRNISYVAWNISNSKGSASIFKYNTTKLDDVSDSNLKVWGIYLKNWYRAKSLNQNEDQEEIVNAEVGLTIEIESESGYLQCFITTQNHSTSRLDYDWSSTNEGILTISKYSTITILSDGKCSIICKNKTTGAIGVLDVEIKDGKLVSFESRHDK